MIYTPETIPSYALESFPAKNVTGHVYTLSGSDLGEFVTDENGYFSLELSWHKWEDEFFISQENPVLIVSAENGVELYHEVSLEEETVDIDMGVANLDSTMITQSMAQEIPGFQGWGKNYNFLLNETELKCFYEIYQEVWSETDVEKHNIKSSFGLLKKFSAHVLGNRKFSLKNKKKQSHFSLLEEELFNLNLEEEIEDGEASLQSFHGFVSILRKYIKSDHEFNFCQRIIEDDLSVSAFTAPILSCHDEVELVDIYGVEENRQAHMIMMEECHKESCHMLYEQPTLFSNFFKFYGEAFCRDYYHDEEQGIVDFVFRGAQCCSNGKSKYEQECMGILERAYQKSDVDQICENQDIVICHIPPGNPENFHTIFVGESAIQAHLNHGDTLGECIKEKEDQNQKESTPSKETQRKSKVQNKTSNEVSNESKTIQKNKIESHKSVKAEAEDSTHYDVISETSETHLSKGDETSIESNEVLEKDVEVDSKHTIRDSKTTEESILKTNSTTTEINLTDEPSSLNSTSDEAEVTESASDETVIDPETLPEPISDSSEITEADSESTSNTTSTPGSEKSQGKIRFRNKNFKE